MLRPSLLVSALVAFSLPVAAQQHPLLDYMVGHWVMQGTIHGAVTTHDVDVDWVVNREYLRIHEVSREKNAAGQPAYTAMVLIGKGAEAGEYQCLWLDSTGDKGLVNPVMGRAKQADDTLPFLFTFKGGETFHTAFVYGRGGGTWQWFMDDEKDGKREPFARLKLTRK